MVQQLQSALDAGVAHLADLLRIEARPFLTMELLVDLGYKSHVYQVDEGIAHIAIVLNQLLSTLKSMGK